jgi:hypothetical protein
MSHHIVEARDLHYIYTDGTPGIRGVSFRITHGESVAIVGANGAEKSCRACSSRFGFKSQMARKDRPGVFATPKLWIWPTEGAYPNIPIPNELSFIRRPAS